MPKKNRSIPPSVPARAIADEESLLDLDSLDWNESDLALITEIEESEAELFWLQDAEAILTNLQGIEAKDINSDLLLNPHTLHPLCLDDSLGVDAARLALTEAIKLSALGELVVTVRSGEPIKSATGAFIFGTENKNIFLATHRDWSEPIVLQKYRYQYRVMDRRTGKPFVASDGKAYYLIHDAKALFPEHAPYLVTANALSHSRVMDKRTSKAFAAPDGRSYHSVPDAKAAFPADAPFLVTAVALYQLRVMDKRTGKVFAAPDGRIYHSVPDAKALFPDDAPHLVTAMALLKSKARAKKCQPADPSGSFSLTEEATHTDDVPCRFVPAALPSSVSKKRPPPIKNPLSVSKDAFFASSREDLASSRLIDTTDASKRWKPNSASV